MTTGKTRTRPTLERRGPHAAHHHIEAAPARLNNAGLFLVVALAIATVGLLYLIQTSNVASLGYEVSRLERERVEKARENEQLTYQIARYEALPQIEQAALGQMMMQPVEDHVFLPVPRPASDELVVPGSPPSRHRSLAELIWDRLTGEAEATHPDVLEQAAP